MPAKLIHGHAQMDRRGEGSPEYAAWYGMKSRCNRVGDISYPNYGGRGIKICERWSDFRNFLKDLGFRPGPGYSLDRIDCNGNYEPLNCRWATRSEQQRNTRKTRFLSHDGKVMSLSDWAEKYEVKPSLIRMRLRRGWDVERSITQPRMNRGRAPK